MSNKRLFLASLLFTGWLCIVYAVPPQQQPTQPAQHNTRTFRNALNQQGIQSILQSIEERLRNLDHIYALRYSTRTDPSTDQFVRRIDMLETKLSRIESLIEVQLEKIAENMSGKNFKDDITKDQIFRKIDSVYERFNHKLGYMESKLDMDILKLQTKVEAGITKIERLDHNIGVRHSDMEAEITEAVEVMATVKSGIATIENKVMNVTRHILENWNEEQMKTMDYKLSNFSQRISSKLENKMNHSCQHDGQKDSPNDLLETTLLMNKFTDYEDKIHSYGNKMNNMYNELWKKSVNIEDSVKNSLQVTNLTRKEIQENMKNLLAKFGNTFTSYDSQNDGTLEIVIDSFTNTLQRKFSEIGRKMDSNFQNVMLTQNLFLESCHRIQMDEAQLENKISLVLEKLIDSFTNKSAATFTEIQNMVEMIKAHDTHIYRSLIQNTNTIIKLSEKTSEDRKKLEKINAQIKQDIVNSLSTILDLMNSENEGYNRKMDIITNILQELQEQVNDLDNRVSEDNMSYNLKQIQQDLVQMKSLVNKDAPPVQEQLNNTILDNNKKSFSKLESLMQNIYQILNTIDAKLNRTDLDYNMNRNDKYQPYAHHRFAPVVKTNLEHSHNADELNSTVHGKNNIEETKNADIIEDIILQMLSDNNLTQSSYGTDINNILNEDEQSQQLIDHDKDKRRTFLTRFNYTLVDKENKQDTDIYRIKNNTHVKETIQSNIENNSGIPINVETNDQIKFMENNSDNVEDKLQNQNIITIITKERNNTDIPIIKPISDTTQSNKKPAIKINNKHITYYSTLSLLKQRQNLTNLFKDLGIIINSQNTSRNNFEQQQNITIIPKEEEIIINGENTTNISGRDLNLTIPAGTLNNEDDLFNVTSKSDSETGVHTADVLNTTDVREHHFGITGLTNATLDDSEEKMVPLNLTDILYDDNNFNIANNTTQDSFEYIDLKNVTNEDGFSELVSDVPEIQEYEDDYFD